MRAKAMVVTAPGELALREFEVLPPAADQVLVKTHVTSVCATDVKVFHGQTPLGRYPVVMGHEFAGAVAAVGAVAARVHGLSVGDLVTVEPYLPCGHCTWCRSDHHYHNCPQGRLYGISLSSADPPHLLGGYAEYVYLLPGSVIHKIAPETPMEAASLSSVVGNGVRWVKTLGRLQFGRSLVISGVGSQGLCALAAAKQAGVGPVVVLGLTRDAARFELAREFGADHLVCVDTHDPLATVPALLGAAPDVVIETSGAPAAIQTAFKLVRTSGRVVLIGLSGGRQTPVAFDELVWRDITVATGKGQAGNVGDAVSLINARRFAFEKINNFKYPLEDLAQALADTADPPDGFIKAAIIFA